MLFRSERGSMESKLFCHFCGRCAARSAQALYPESRKAVLKDGAFTQFFGKRFRVAILFYIEENQENKFLFPVSGIYVRYFLLWFLYQLYKIFIGLDVVKNQFKHATLQPFEGFTQFLVPSRTFDGVLVRLSAA